MDYDFPFVLGMEKSSQLTNSIIFQRAQPPTSNIYIYTYQSGIAWDSMVLDITHCLVQGTVVPLKKCGPHGPRMMAVRHKDSRRMAFP
jgi:hypothetical protein